MAVHFQVRDKRRNDRFFVDNVVIRHYGQDLGPYGIATYMAIALHADYEEQSAFPSYETLASLTGMSRRQAIREVEKLVGIELLGVESRDGKSNVFYLLDPPCLQEAETPGGQEGGDRESPLHEPTSDRESPGGDRESLPGVTGSHPNDTQFNDTQEQSTPEADASGGSRFACPVCGQLCRSKGGLTNHRKRHGEDARRPAVKVYQEITGRRPKQAIRDLISRRVGGDSLRVDFWSEVVTDYCACGWNPLNVKTMLEFFDRGELPSVKRRVKSEVQGEKDRRAYISGEYAAYIEH